MSFLLLNLATQSSKEKVLNHTDQSFPKTLRLRSSGLFKTVMDQGVKFVGRNFILFGLHKDLSSSDKLTRLGIIVSKRVGIAVERNRVKRIVREVFRKSKSGWKQNTDTTVVVIVRHNASSLTNDAMSTEFSKLLEKIKNCEIRNRD